VNPSAPASPGMDLSAKSVIRAKELEQEAAQAIHTLIPSQLKQSAAKLKSTLANEAAVADLNKCFSTPAISVQSLLTSVENALKQIHAETAAEEQLKVAMKKGNLEAIQLAVVVAEQTIKAREDTYLSPTTPALGNIVGLPSYAARQSKTSGLDALLTGAYAEQKRLQRIREASQALKDLGMQFDDNARIREILQEAIDAGVPSGETEIVGRRLREAETRSTLQHAMDQKDIAGLDAAIAEAEHRLANNEMEILTNRFQGVLNAAKHAVALLRSLEALNVSAEALRKAHADAPPGLAGARTADIVRCEADFKAAYSTSLMLGARDDDLFIVEDLHQPLRKDPREMTGEELLTERDMQQKRTQAHYEAVRRHAKEEADRQMEQQKQSRAAKTGGGGAAAPSIPARTPSSKPSTRPSTRDSSPATRPDQVRLEERRPSTKSHRSDSKSGGSRETDEKHPERRRPEGERKEQDGRKKARTDPTATATATKQSQGKSLGEMSSGQGKTLGDMLKPNSAEQPRTSSSRPPSQPGSRRSSKENIIPTAAGDRSHSGSRRHSRDPLPGDSVVGWENGRTPRKGGEIFNTDEKASVATPRTAAFVIKAENSKPPPKRVEPEPAPVKACCVVQ
jgi:hypothetical protein